MPLSNRSFATAGKAAIYRSFINSSTWYAACEEGHFFWAGPDRHSVAEAEADAANHNQRKHAGSHGATCCATSRARGINRLSFARVWCGINCCTMNANPVDRKGLLFSANIPIRHLTERGSTRRIGEAER